MKIKTFKVKVQCPYCNRIETLKNLVIGEINATKNYYYYEDIQCNSCGSKYDLRMDFYPTTERQHKERRKKLKKEGNR